MKSKFTLFFFLTLLLQLDILFAQSNQSIDKPQRIILNLTENPATSIALTWRTINKFSNSEVRFTEATNWTDFLKSVQSLKTKIDSVKIDEVHYAFQYSVILKNLKPNTLYVYSVGHDSVWSEWNQFKTAEDKNAKFDFIYFGDPQVELIQHCSRLFREAYKTDAAAKFWLFVGDLTDKPNYDSLWGAFFFAVDFFSKVTPLVTVPGNHEYTKFGPGKTKTKEFTPLYRPHFTLPENGIKGMEEKSYYFDYQGARFIMLDGNERLDEQAKWMEPLLTNNPNKWTIVSMHQAIYSTGRTRDNKEIQKILLPLYNKYSVDLVLQGDDHTYGRTYKLRNGVRVNDNENGTVYIVSVSGPKQYTLNPKYKDLMVKMGEKTQLFQVITVDNNKLIFKSYTITGELFDSFELNKK
ncbi:MAG: metallophosphoesterase family protein [Ignavibacteriales bacterium]|nr:metallophosphoesterase family protein [Ignavibacteriales bacterium]